MLTKREVTVLKYLDTRMEATARQIGAAIISAGWRGGYVAVAAGTLGHMNKKGLVMRLPDLNAWRITDAGRNKLCIIAKANL